MTAVTIPAELAAEVDADMRAFRPAVTKSQRVLVLADAAPELDPSIVGGIGVVEHGNADGTVPVVVEHGNADGTVPVVTVRISNSYLFAASAWALVGSAEDPNSARPRMGDRVLVLEGLVIAGEVGLCTGTFDNKAIMVNPTGRGGSYRCTRWAILPPAGQADTSDESPGPSSEVGETQLDDLTQAPAESVMSSVMTHRPSSDFIQSLDVTGLIPLDVDYFAPTEARQFAVEAPDGAILHASNDQGWVKDGRALVRSTCLCPNNHRDVPDGSHVVERDITITYGPWRPVYTVPETALVEDESDQAEGIVAAALDHALVAYDFDPNNPGMAPIGFARAAVRHAMNALAERLEVRTDG